MELKLAPSASHREIVPQLTLEPLPQLLRLAQPPRHADRLEGTARRVEQCECTLAVSIRAASRLHQPFVEVCDCAPGSRALFIEHPGVSCRTTLTLRGSGRSVRRVEAGDRKGGAPEGARADPNDRACWQLSMKLRNLKELGVLVASQDLRPCEHTVQVGDAGGAAVGG